MDERLIGNLEQIRQLCSLGYVDKALSVLDGIIHACPEYSDDLLYEKAVLEFENGRPKDALIDFISCYERTGSKDVLTVISAYSAQNESEYKENFNKNKKLLESYPLYYGNRVDECHTKVMWYDDSLIVFFDTKKNVFHQFEYAPENKGPFVEEPILLAGVLSPEEVLGYVLACREAWSVNDRRIPVLLFYLPESLNAFLQISDLESLLNMQKLVFLVGDEAFNEYYEDIGPRFPQYVFGSEEGYSSESLIERLQSIYNGKANRINEIIDNNISFYNNNLQEINRRINEKNPRVYIITSRYTSALQYHAKDCAKALKEMGIEVLLSIEDKNTQQISSYDIAKAIQDFHPDIVLLLDHFRFEYGPFLYPENLVFVSWIQDTLPVVFEAPNKLFPRDIVMTHLLSKEIREIYKDVHCIDAIVPSNEDRYRPYELTDEEKQKYGCDICMVCHASDVENYSEQIISSLINMGVVNPEETVNAMITDYYHAALAESFLYSKEEFREFVESRVEMWNNDEAKEYLIETLRNRMNQRIYRQVLADWLIEAGYTNIKLWGTGWLNSPKYTKYAMGPADNGETLSKINQASRIVLGNNINITAATRVWETMLSGGFYLSNYIPPEEDWCDIRRVMTEGEEFVMFHNKTELLEQVKHYLTHEEDRQEMIRRGREAALKKMTFKGLMKKMIEEIPVILEEQRA